jgi:hypothetical protein
LTNGVTWVNAVRIPCRGYLAGCQQALREVVGRSESLKSPLFGVSPERAIKSTKIYSP